LEHQSDTMHARSNIVLLIIAYAFACFVLFVPAVDDMFGSSAALLLLIVSCTLSTWVALHVWRRAPEKRIFLYPLFGGLVPIWVVFGMALWGWIRSAFGA